MDPTPQAASTPAYQPPQQSGSRGRFWLVFAALIWGIGLGGACMTCAQVAQNSPDQIFAEGPDRVGVIELLGPITDAKDFVQQMREFAQRDDLSALVVRIDSPGGSVAPSQEIFDSIRWASQRKPVVASMGSVAASGGFWTALAADEIYASPGTITGSIGVITQMPDLRGVAELVNFRMNTYKSGPLKDVGNPLREATEADKAMFQGMINDIYQQFVDVTVERRKLSEEQVRAVADGRVMTGRAAQEAGLVDSLGGLYAAAYRAMVLAKARNGGTGQTDTSTTGKSELEPPTLVYPKPPRPQLLELLGQGASSAVSEGVSTAIKDTFQSGLDSSSRAVQLR